MTAKAEVSRLLAIFNALSENDKDIVLKVSETIKQPEIIPSPSGIYNSRADFKRGEQR